MKKQTGFTLLEISISLLIIGFLLAGVLGPLSTQIEQKERQATQSQLDNIKEALLGFTITKGRLPCPDSDSTTDGIENVDTTGLCNDSSGVLPYVTLGTSEFDAWGQHFAYTVTAEFADNIPGASNGISSPCGTATVGVSFELCSEGDLKVETLNASGITVTLVEKIPALVFSNGKDNFTSSSLEQENQNGDTTFFYEDYRKEETKEFDDLMIWISPNILKNRMVQAGRLP